MLYNGPCFCQRRGGLSLQPTDGYDSGTTSVDKMKLSEEASRQSGNKDLLDTGNSVIICNICIYHCTFLHVNSLLTTGHGSLTTFEVLLMLMS